MNNIRREPSQTQEREESSIHQKQRREEMNNAMKKTSMKRGPSWTQKRGRGFYLSKATLGGDEQQWKEDQHQEENHHKHQREGREFDSFGITPRKGILTPRIVQEHHEKDQH